MSPISKKEKRTDCYLCGAPLPQKPIYALTTLDDGTPIARPMCDTCGTTETPPTYVKK